MSDVEPNDKTSKEFLAKNLVNQLRKGKKLYDEFSEELSTKYRINNKLINEWQKYFKVKLPPDPTTRTLQQVDSKLMELHQEATFFKACCQAKLQAAKDRNADAFRQKFTALVAEYNSQNKKLPAKDTLTHLAEDATSDLKSITMHAEIEYDFWKEVLNDLANCRKLVENATFNISVEAKALQNEKYIDAINNKKNNHY